MAGHIPQDSPKIIGWGPSILCFGQKYNQKNIFMVQEKISGCRIQFILTGLIFSLIVRRTQMRQKRLNLD